MMSDGDIENRKATPVRERVTVPSLRLRKQQGKKIVVVTAYDFSSAKLAERAEVDVVLVGDTLSVMALGNETTIPVTLEQMLHHVQAVRPALKRTLLVADMPFGTYQVSTEDALRNAIRFMKEGGAQAVKVEGAGSIVETVRRMHEIGIPVMAHLGLTPQSVHQFGGHKAQGKLPEEAEKLRRDAELLEQAGAFALVLEAIPAELAQIVTEERGFPTIGIGAGAYCDGQVQVWHDILGLPPGKNYRHVKRFAEIGSQIEAALREYAEEVREGTFPTKENSL